MKAQDTFWQNRKGLDPILLKVLKAYWQKYPESIAFYIMEYRKWYDPESLKGTKWEYLLEEDKDLYDEEE